MTQATAPAPLLELRDIRRDFRTSAGTVRAVDGVSLTVQSGETLAVVGESGCGKSTLGRVSLGLQRPSAGSARLDGIDLSTLSHSHLRLLRKRMQMIFQDPVSSLNPRMTAGQAVGEPLRELEGVPAPERRRRVHALLERVGLSGSVAQRYPSQLSGGQAQRVAIARALSVRPSMLVADEPVSAVDVSVAAQILNLLEDLRTDLSIACFFISHDLAVVQHISDRVLVMYLGKVMELGQREDVFAKPQHPYTVALLSATPVPDPARARTRERIILRGDPPSPANPPSGCRFRSRCPIGPLAHPERRICIEQEPPLAQTPAGQQAACHFAGELRAS